MTNLIFNFSISGTESQTCNFKCEHCAERFLDRRALTWHEKKAHNVVRNTQNSDKVMFCELCGQSFPTIHKLSVHKNIKHSKETGGNINAHHTQNMDGIQELDANPRIKQINMANSGIIQTTSEVKCVDCNLIFINSDELLRHMSELHVTKTE